MLTASAHANTERDPSVHAAQDINYTKYPSYAPYGTYVPYSAAVEAEATKMNMGKSYP